MPDLSSFPIAQRWPGQHPDRLQLYSAPTPNGIKVAIMLEEIGLPYEAHLVRISADESHLPEFRSVNPNGKIPAILDPDGPGGEPIALFESGAILFYLGEKTGRLIPADAAGRYHALQWVMWQMAGLGPMAGQLGWFSRPPGRDIEDKRPRDRYAAEVHRLLGVLDGVLATREWVAGDDYGIADIACIGWVRGLSSSDEARALTGFDERTSLGRWLAACLARPAVQRGLNIPARG